MATMLDTIIARKKEEVTALYQKYDLARLKNTVAATQRHFYREIADSTTPFWICEFKRKSPSEGWINEHAAVAEQVTAYAAAGARAVSVLTDTYFFGGSYADLQTAAGAFSALAHPPLLLQKDFVIDEIQIYLARLFGADMVLLIATVLAPAELQRLRLVAESLGMGVLVEVHDLAELDPIQHLDFPVLGVNNRDLRTFRTALNRVNAVAQQANGRQIISESGVNDYRDFKVVDQANGFLIGTGLMRRGAMALQQLQVQRPLLKACGIRTADLAREETADFIGINFSPISKRRMPEAVLQEIDLPDNAVAVFYKNTPDEIHAILHQYPFKRVQLYAGDVSVEFVRQLKCKVILAVRIETAADIALGLEYAGDIDFFILDGPVPGSGMAGDKAIIPSDFPYPFLLAGGIHAGNIHLMHHFQRCIGIDTASGIETHGEVDMDKIRALKLGLGVDQ